MKIAIAGITGFSGKGGTEVVIRTVMKELEGREDIQVKLFLLGSYNNDWLAGLDYTILSSSKTPETKGVVKSLINYYFCLLKYKPDVILCVNTKGICVTKMMTKLLPYKVKVGSWLHFSLKRLGADKYLKMADFHLAICNEIAEDIKAYIAPKNGNVYTVYNPVPVPNYFIKEPEIPTFAYVGRLMYEGDKQVKDLIIALSKVEGDYKVKIVGSGEEGKLKKLAIELGINDKINWMGWSSKPWKDLKQVTAVVMTSRNEGFSLIPIEAMMRGVPCISSNCSSGPKEIIHHGKNGLLYVVGDIDTLSMYLQQIIDGEIVFENQVEIKKSVEQSSKQKVVYTLVESLQTELSL